MGIWWYADHPTHYCGDGRPATAEKGDRWLADRAQALAKIIRAIKADNQTKKLQDDFFGKVQQP
jgi:creatinine amidohydrolase